MKEKTFRNAHYTIPGHAHDITFSVYRRQNLFLDPQACRMLGSRELGTCERLRIMEIWITDPCHTEQDIHSHMAVKGTRRTGFRAIRLPGVGDIVTRLKDIRKENSIE